MKSFIGYSILALAAILFNGAEQFCWRVTQGVFLYNYFKIRLLVKAEKSFKGISIFSSEGHFVQRSRMVRAILVEGFPRKVPVKLI